MPAAGDLSSYQFHGMIWSAAEAKVTIGNANGDLLLGALMNKPGAAGEPAKIHTLPGSIVTLYAGAAITAPTFLTTDASGHFITTTTETDVVVAISMEDAGAAGDLIRAYWIGINAGADISRWTSGA